MSTSKNFIIVDRSESPESMESLPALSPRELDVLQVMAMGHSRAMIAKSLNVSPHTVTTHIKHIYKKLGAHSRTEAIFIAQQKQIICFDHAAIN